MKRRPAISPAQREFDRLAPLRRNARPRSHAFMWRALAVLIIFVIVGLVRG